MGSPPSDSSIAGAEKLPAHDDVDNLSAKTFDPQSDAELEKTVWRKMDMWILPVVSIFYLLSFLVSSIHLQMKDLSEVPLRVFTDIESLLHYSSRNFNLNVEPDIYPSYRIAVILLMLELRVSRQTSK